MKPLHPHWREVFARKEPEMEIETICPMKPLRLPYRERLCKIPKACVIKGVEGVSHTVCRIRPSD